MIRKASPFTDIRALVFEGGGVWGLAYPRALERLAEHLGGSLRGINTLIGTSAGAITAALVALGAEGEFLRRICVSTPWAEFRDGDFGILRDSWRLIRRLGYYRLDYPRQWLSERFAELDTMPSTTFDELAARTGRFLKVVATNETTRSLTVFGPETHPHVPVVDAVLASMAIPFFFPPVEIGANLYCDGGLLANQAMSLVDDWPLEQVLGFRVDSDAELRTRWPRPRTVIGRAVGIFDCLMRHSRASHVPPRYASRIVRIRVGDLSPVRFQLDAGERLRLTRQADRAFDAFERLNADGVEV